MSDSDALLALQAIDTLDDRVARLLYRPVGYEATMAVLEARNALEDFLTATRRLDPEERDFVADGIRIRRGMTPR